MLSTINGFDLMLIIIIIGLVINIFKLNRECESYVRQIIEVSRDNYELTKEVVEWETFYDELLQMASAIEGHPDIAPDLDHELLDSLTGEYND